MKAFGLIKGCVAVLCLVFFFYQVYISFEKLRSNDIISISESLPLDEFEVPGIRFCQETGSFRNISTPNDMSEIYKLKTPLNETILGVYIGYFMTVFFSAKSFQQLAPDPEQWTEDTIPIFFDEHDRAPFHQQTDCFTLDAGNKKTALGTTDGVQIYINVSKSYKHSYQMLYISEPGNSFFTNKMIYGIGIQTLDINDLDLSDNYKLNVLSYSIGLTIRKKLPVKDKFNCLANGKDTLNYCFQRYLITQMQCKSPFVKGFAEYPICSSKADLDKQKSVYSLGNFSSFNLNFFMNDLKCELPCTYKEYTLSPALGGEYPCTFAEGCKDLIMIQIYSTNDEYDVVTEKWLYDEANFIADVGGYLGLLLGVSVLTMLDYIRMITDKAQKYLNRRTNVWQTK